MEIKLFQNIVPVSGVLSKYIHSFTLTSEDAIYPICYVAFPHVRTCLSFFNQTEIQIEHSHISFHRNVEAKPSVVLLGRIEKPVSVTFNDPIEEISINFTACGINYFFDKSFYCLAKHPHQILNEAKWNIFALELFSVPISKRLAMLEDFLLDCLDEDRKEVLEKIYDRIIRREIQKVNELAEQVNMSERTFLRHFRAYFGCSPSVFNKIRRFRHAIEEAYDGNGYKKRLFDDTYYYDPAHFRKDFQRFTNSKLGQFYSSSFMIGNGGTPFKLK